MEFSFPMVQKYEWICMVGFGNSLEWSLHVGTNKIDIWPWGSMLWWQTQPYKLLNSLEWSLCVSTNKMDIWPWSSSVSLYGWVWQWSHSLEWSTAHHYDHGRDLDKQGDFKSRFFQILVPICKICWKTHLRSFSHERLAWPEFWTEKLQHLEWKAGWNPPKIIKSWYLCWGLVGS